MSEKESGIIYSCLSDHLPVFTVSKSKVDFSKELQYYARHFSEQNKSSFKNKLLNHDWTSIMLELNPETAFSSFSSILEEHYEDSFPVKKTKPNKN